MHWSFARGSPLRAWRTLRDLQDSLKFDTGKMPVLLSGAGGTRCATFFVTGKITVLLCMTINDQLLRRIRILTGIFIVGLVLSGVTAIPLVTELNWLVNWFGLEGQTSTTASTEFGRWLLRVREALVETQSAHPQLFYGTDWLAFGHLVIAVAFIGALRDPVRNRWLFDFGLIACVLVIPWAFVFGTVRGIPFWWRLIDCSFGVFGAVPLWFCRQWVRKLVRENHASSQTAVGCG